jgi:hypothetical protein
VSQRSRDTWLYFSAITTGAVLVCVLLSSWATSTRVMVAVAGLGLALAGISQWRRSRHRGDVKTSVVDVASVLIDAESRSEILFGPALSAESPRLVMSAHGRPVAVEDVWHAGVSVLAEPRAVVHWRRGVEYPGTVDSRHPLKILLHNQGFTPAMVHAQLVVPEGSKDVGSPGSQTLPQKTQK